ncbi:hypothetical protein M1466_01725 [Candidatus Dependentiae bacterium]|nr:hypothetical protein [Candidatus Dependentiae bacterium]
MKRVLQIALLSVVVVALCQALGSQRSKDRRVFVGGPGASADDFWSQRR